MKHEAGKNFMRLRRKKQAERPLGLPSLFFQRFTKNSSYQRRKE